MITRKGMSIRFHETTCATRAAPPAGSAASNLKGKDDYVVTIEVVDTKPPC
jgi:hypothetical protein